MRAPARWAVMAAILAADRLTKLWVLQWLAPRRSVVLAPFFSLTYVENTGAAFGMGFGRNTFFIWVSGILLAVILYLQAAWTRKSLWLQVGLTLVAGGAIGNLYDRFAYSFVVDFLDFHAGSFVWPAFNVADSCVSIGACCLGWGMWLEDRQAKPG